MSAWSPELPTEPLLSTRDRLVIQSGNIQLDLNLPLLQYGIIPFLNQYVKVWHGKVPRDTFLKKFFYIRSKIITNLQTLPTCLSSTWQSFDGGKYGQYQTTAFNIYMCRLAQTQNWSFPVVYVGSSWANGGSRCFASGICYESPWTKFYGLEFLNNNQSSNLNSPVLVDSDAKLHEILNFKYDNTKKNQSIDANLTVYLKDNQIDIQHLGDGFDNGTNPESFKLWDQYVAWRTQYPTKPKIKIYTNWPKQVHNQFGAWDVVEIVPSQHMIDEIQGFGGRSGRLERFANEEHRNPKETVDHVLYVIDPRPMELGDLLVWMDMEHSTYIESTWKFLLYRKAAVYKNTYIDTSYIMQ